MSASPSGPSNGGTPTANGAPPKFMRRPKPADPLRKSTGRPQRPPPLPKSSAAKLGGLKPAGRPGHAIQSSSTPSSRPSFSSNGPPIASLPKAPGGFTEISRGPYKDYPLYTTKRAIRDGLRYHVAKFSTSNKGIDPSDQSQFTRPVSLHRRDPRLPPPGKLVKDDDPATGLPLDDKDQEKLEIAKLEREAQRAADLAQIAPTGNNASALAAKKNTSFRNEKTTQVYRNDSNEEQKKESDLKYEESVPWILEDAENKHTWFGTYEAALSHAQIILVSFDDCFKMVPVEKWYKFTAKNQFKALTIEEAEAQMNKKSKTSRWIMHAQNQQQQDQEKRDTQRLITGLFKVKGESSTSKRSGKAEIQDTDDIDFEGDLFEDDDEQVTVEPDRDEETKHAAEKIKREQLGANLFGEGDENEVEKEILEEEKEEKAKKKFGKRMKKALKKREKNLLYDSDSSHPYSTSSDDDTSDEEKMKEEERKKEEEAKLKAKSASKIPSGASSKGTNTPLDRPKHGEAQKKPNHLKRPGSPNLSASETSGNESSRKKHKKKHIGSSSQPTGTSTPAPSRPMSPVPSASQPTQGTNSRKSSIIKLNLNPSKLSQIQSAPPNPSAVMSDGEGTAGEMSDSAGDHKRKSIKLRLGSGPSHSQSASRAGSPANGSRAGSPIAQGQQPSMLAHASPPASGSTAATKPVSTRPITVEEIIAALPPTGISISAMLKLFPSKIVEKKDRDRFIKLVKENSSYSPDDKLLRPKV